MIYTWRCLLCEWLISLALKIAPADYEPSFVEAVNFAEGRITRPLP